MHAAGMPGAFGCFMFFFVLYSVAIFVGCVGESITFTNLSGFYGMTKADLIENANLFAGCGADAIDKALGAAGFPGDPHRLESLPAGAQASLAFGWILLIVLCVHFWLYRKTQLMQLKGKHIDEEKVAAQAAKQIELLLEEEQKEEKKQDANIIAMDS
mmetsp:Transcript_11177/g.15042  ORF Transcript_11177/g.15042 Transcript_11177/m.15042 type:complete len:158 (+) Transcript_11177:159-632(+)